MEEQLYQQFYVIEDNHWWFTARRSILMAYLLRRVNTDRRLRLLDVGCGTGAFLASASRYFEVYGMDNSPEATGFCQKRGLTNLYTGALEDYPASGTFDIITLLDVIEHIDHDSDLLRHVYGRLNEGGHVLITVPSYRWLWSAHDEVNHHKRRYTRSRLKSVVNDAGFHIEHITYFNTFLFPLAAARRLVARLTGTREASDFIVPGEAVNTMLRGVFSAEQYLLPFLCFPFGLSVLCWATKPRT